MRYLHINHHLYERHHRSPRLNRVITYFMWGFAILSPLTTLPQIITIYRTHEVSGISLITWFLYIVSPTIWLAYGLMHRDKFIIINNLLWASLSVLVFWGVWNFR